MDTNEYATFEYLQPSNQEIVNKRLFLVQENGTYLSIDRTVDLTQVPNVELLEEVQPVYNVSPEQFYIDVDGSQELVRVSEQFLLSNKLHEQDNILIGNDVMLQQESSSSNIQIQETVGEMADNVVEQFIKKEGDTINNNIDMEVDTASSYTEIMISDEQYKLLEQKGWTLVDNEESIYYIDGFGVHNITNNDQLIQELKEKIRRDEPNTTEIDTSNMIMETVLEDGRANNPNCDSTAIPYKDEAHVKIEPSNDGHPKLETVRILPKPIKKEVPVFDPTVHELSENYDSDSGNNSNTIKIKTKFSLKDIPSEMVLGKTVNGKKLVARVIKRERRDATSKATVALQKRDFKTYETTAFDGRIEKLIEEAVRSPSGASPDEAEVSNAERIVQQLLRVPAFKPAVAEHPLVITKVSVTEGEGRNVKGSAPTLVAGWVTSRGDDKWTFMNVPDMFHKLKEHGASAGGRAKKGNRSIVNCLHIHIQEEVGADGNARCAVSLNRREFLLKCMKLRLVTSNGNTELKRVYACGACASIFNTENKYVQHQELHHVADNLKSNVVKTSALYRTAKSGSKKVFQCKKCRFKTPKQSIIHRHVKTHFDLLIKDQEAPDEGVVEGKHKCKCCSVSYKNALTLSKHFISTHIKVLDA